MSLIFFSVKSNNGQLSRFYIILQCQSFSCWWLPQVTEPRRVSNGSGSGQAAAAALVTPESGAIGAGAEDSQLVSLHSILPPSGQQIYRGPQTSEAIQVSVL